MNFFASHGNNRSHSVCYSYLPQLSCPMIARQTN